MTAPAAPGLQAVTLGAGPVSIDDVVATVLDWAAPLKR